MSFFLGHREPFEFVEWVNKKYGVVLVGIYGGINGVLLYGLRESSIGLGYILLKKRRLKPTKAKRWSCIRSFLERMTQLPSKPNKRIKGKIMKKTDNLVPFRLLLKIEGVNFNESYLQS